MNNTIHTILMSNEKDTVEVEWAEGTLDVEFQQEGIVKHPKDYPLVDVFEVIQTSDVITYNLRYDMDLENECMCFEIPDHVHSTCRCGSDQDKAKDEYVPIGIRKEVR